MRLGGPEMYSSEQRQGALLREQETVAALEEAERRLTLLRRPLSFYLCGRIMSASQFARVGRWQRRTHACMRGTLSMTVGT